MLITTDKLTLHAVPAAGKSKLIQMQQQQQQQQT
jgi:hypothetical protein